MSRFCNMYSSSKGNCTFLSSGTTSILIDAGVSFKALSTAMAVHGLVPDNFEAVFISHEHSDHIKGLPMIVKKLNIPIYATAETLRYLIYNDKVPAGAKLLECKENQIIGDIQVGSFEIPHDACSPIGFTFVMPDDRKLAIVTDLGHVTNKVREAITGCDLVMIESNYDLRMLECSHYPYMLKHRIKGLEGHLSNDDCAKEIVKLVENGTTRIVLAHLSQDNNMPQVAYQTAKSTLEKANMKENFDYILKVSSAKGPGEMIIF